MIRLILSFHLLLMFSACTTPHDEALTTQTETTSLLNDVVTFTPIPTAIIPTMTPTDIPTATWTPVPTNTPTDTPMPTLTATPTPRSPTNTPPPTSTPTDTATPEPARIDHYWLRRPIERNDDLVDWLDRTYPYGSTQLGERAVHLGVDFFNPRFTPVLASADGIVVFAGDDSVRLLGPEHNYYGNVILIEHPDLSSEQPFFTLYAHLETLRVSTGDSVSAGQVIGTVGDSGIAIGPHLHLEVRLGDGFDYRNTRNPDLWIQPYPQFGTLAGRVELTDGTLVDELTVFIYSSTRQRQTYTYAFERVNSTEAWQENFTHGDLPVGDYDFFITDAGGSLLYRQDVTIQNGRTTFIEVVLPAR